MEHLKQYSDLIIYFGTLAIVGALGFIYGAESHEEYAAKRLNSFVMELERCQERLPAGRSSRR